MPINSHIVNIGKISYESFLFFDYLINYTHNTLSDSKQNSSKLVHVMTNSKFNIKLDFFYLPLMVITEDITLCLFHNHFFNVS